MTIQGQSKRKPSRVAAIFLWLAAVICALLSLVPGLKNLSAGYGIAGVLFIIMLSWILAHLPPRTADIPAIDLFHAQRMSFAAMTGLLLVGIIGVFLVGMMVGPGVSTLALAALIGLIISIRWRRELDRRTLLIGAGAGIIAAGGTIWLGNGDLTWAAFNLVCLPPIFTAGALLARRTTLAKVQVLEGTFRLMLKGFLSGCILAIPAALFNLLGNMQAGDIWVQHWWQPLYAFVPAVAEETWARLFLLTLIYALLRPSKGARPNWSIGLAILGSSLVHGFAHSGINPFGIVLGSLLYGIPAGLLFVKRDFEHAVGYHFMVDVVRWIAALYGWFPTVLIR